jgi:hypothetical protein
LAWQRIQRQKPKRPEIDEDLAQVEIFRAAFVAPDLARRTKAEIAERKAIITDSGKQLTSMASKLYEINAADPQLAMQVGDLVRLYGIGHNARLPNDLGVIAGLLAHLGHVLGSTVLVVPWQHSRVPPGEGPQRAVRSHEAEATCPYGR